MTQSRQLTPPSTLPHLSMQLEEEVALTAMLAAVVPLHAGLAQRYLQLQSKAAISQPTTPEEVRSFARSIARHHFMTIIRV